MSGVSARLLREFCPPSSGGAFSGCCLVMNSRGGGGDGGDRMRPAADPVEHRSRCANTCYGDRVAPQPVRGYVKRCVAFQRSSVWEASRSVRKGNEREAQLLDAARVRVRARV